MSFGMHMAAAGDLWRETAEELGILTD
jgi:hypothetical protein